MKKYTQLLLCLALLLTSIITAEQAQAITIVTADPYDASVDAKSRAIAEDVKISDYQEQPITAPGIDVPIGMDVRFKVSQTLGNSFTISLDRQMALSQWMDMNFSCQNTESKYLSSGYDISGEAEKTVHFRCMPWGRQWDKDKQIIYSLGAASGEAPASTAKANIILAIGITNPNCKSFIPNPPGFHTDYECRRYTQNISNKLPADKLDSSIFWYNAMSHTTQQALVDAGYALCSTQGNYCRKDPAKLEAVTISNYEEKPFNVPGFDAPVGLFISFDVTQKSNEYSAISIQTINGRYPMMQCDDLSEGSKGTEESKYTSPTIFYGGDRYPLIPQGTTKVKYLCGPRSMNVRGQSYEAMVQNPMDQKDPFKIQAFLYKDMQEKNSQNMEGLDVSEKLMPLITTNHQLLSFDFWEHVMYNINPQTFLDAGYSPCTAWFELGWCQNKDIIAGKKLDVAISNYHEDPLILETSLTSEPLKTPVGLIVSFDVAIPVMQRGAVTLHTGQDSPIVCESGIGDGWGIMDNAQAKTVHVTYACRLKGIRPVFSSASITPATHTYITREVNFDAAKIKEFADILKDTAKDKYKVQLLLRGMTVKDSNDITDSLFQILPKDSKLQQPAFWQNIGQTVTPQKLHTSDYSDVSKNNNIPPSSHAFKITVDTAALNNQTGFISLQFSPSYSGVSKSATASIRNFTIDGGSVVSPAHTAHGNVSGALPETVTLRNEEQKGVKTVNGTQIIAGGEDVLQEIHYGKSFSFEVEFSGDAIDYPGDTDPPREVEARFGVVLTGKSGSNFLLTDNKNGATIITLDVTRKGVVRTFYQSSAVKIEPLPSTKAVATSSTPPLPTSSSQDKPRHSYSYKVAIDTSTLGNGEGKVDFQLNGGADAKSITAVIRHFTVDGGSVDAVVEKNGEVSGQLPDEVTLTSTKPLNDILQGIHFGRSFSFDAELSGEAVEHPGGTAGNSLSVSLYGKTDKFPLLTTNPSGAIITFNVDTEGRFHMGFMSPAVKGFAASSDAASVAYLLSSSSPSSTPVIPPPVTIPTPPPLPSPPPPGTTNFILDPASTVQFNPVQYLVRIDPGLTHSNFEVFLTDHSEDEKRLKEPYFPSIPQTPHNGRRDISITFHGKPIIGKEYRADKLLNPTNDWRQSDFELENDDGSSMFMHSSNFSLPGTSGVAVSEMRVTYIALPDKSGDELSLRLEVIFKDGKFIRGILNVPAKDATQGI